jgi:hypothetical protein
MNAVNIEGDYSESILKVWGKYLRLGGVNAYA